TSPASEFTYSDDVYIFEANDAQYGPITQDVVGMWLVDEFGTRCRILGASGNALTLQRGHYMYVDRFKTDGTRLTIPNFPTGVVINERVRRGNWMIVADTLVPGEFPRVSNWPAGLDRDVPDADKG